MLIINLKLIFRNLWARKVYTSVILLSLIVGFACANILISFLVFEKSTDSFHTKRDRIFQLFSNDPFGSSGRIAYIPSYLPEYLTSNYAEVEKVCQIGNLTGVTVQTPDQKFSDLAIVTVDSTFFSLFDFPVAQGNKANCIGLGKIVLTKAKALTLFQDTNVIGRELILSTTDTSQQVLVSAVVDKPIENSHLNFDALLHHSVFPDKWNGGPGYVLLHRPNTGNSLLEKINTDPQRPGLIGEGKMSYSFTPLADSYFSTDNKAAFITTRNPMFITIGYVVCALVIFIASFNFINLFLLFWQKRKKEIGIKKTLGVTQLNLLSYSFTEAGVYILTGYSLSLLVTYFVLPTFNTVFEANLAPAYFLNLTVITLLGALLFLSISIMVILSVSRQWKMKAINLMTRDTSRTSFSKLLFTIQFVISITLAVCAITIIEQMEHLRSAPLGFNRHLIQLNTPDRKFTEGMSLLKNKVAQLQDVNHVTLSGGNPISGNWMARYDLEDNTFYSPYLFSGDEDFFSTLDLTLMAGQMPSETNTGKVVNETLIKQFDIKEPIGTLIPGTKDAIIGVVKDFTCGSFKQEIPPVIISYSRQGSSLLVDYKGNELARLIPQLEILWREVFPDYPFNQRIIQEDLMKKYKEDTFFYKIVITFSVMSMILSCFGLFALSWAVIQSRTKEMGIRKVLGATVVDISNLLTITFTKRIVLAFAVAAPVGYYVMNLWLARFANKIEIGVGIFISAAFIVTAIALFTLSLQTIKAAIANPVDELRTE
ncbi:MAG TPA: FtsX-like permease family protein [Cyclobacteriaceae bacterium]|nr:FtsX-like permease family protein [Cyclobacteriaceae bacterium]